MVQICVMPANFVQFWDLIWNRKVQTDSGNIHEFYEWKLAFDQYREALPAFYNDYFNSYFKFL